MGGSSSHRITSPFFAQTLDARCGSQMPVRHRQEMPGETCDSCNHGRHHRARDAAQRLFGLYHGQRQLTEDLVSVNDRLERANISFATAASKERIPLKT